MPETKDEIRNRIERLPRWEGNPLKSTGVLRAAHIELLSAAKYRLVDPFEPRSLKPAAYELRIGDECYISGVYHELTAQRGHNAIEIPPFEVAVVKTREFLNVPPFLVAHWNIRVSLAYQGLLWVGGPQVDAGYRGYLFCPLFNLSDQPRRLEFEQPFASIEFATVAEDKKPPKEYPTTRFVIDDYDAGSLHSALSSRLACQLGDLEKEVANMKSKAEADNNRQLTGMGFIIAAISAVVTALALIATPADTNQKIGGILVVLTLGVALSITTSVAAWARSVRCKS